MGWPAGAGGRGRIGRVAGQHVHHRRQRERAHDQRPHRAWRQAAQGRHRRARREELRLQGDGRRTPGRQPLTTAQRAARFATSPWSRDCSSCTASPCAVGDESGELVLDPSNVERAHVADIDAHAGSSRIPILFCGPLVHRLGEAFIPDLGGCVIGDRPINYHLEALRKFGAVVDKRDQGIRISAPEPLRGTKFELDFPSVGATEQVLLTAVRAEGITELRNAAIEPEIMDLIAVLQKMGAIISVEPNRVILIEGVSSLSGYTHRSLPDRIEAASWASAALATGGDVYVRGRPSARPDDVPQHVPQGGGPVRGRRRRHPLLPPRRTSALARAGDGRAPGLHDGLAAAARRRADPGAGPVDRARDRVREPVRLRRRAGGHGGAHPGLPRVPRFHPVPLRSAQLPALGGDQRSDEAARRRHRGAGPARRLLAPDRSARRGGRVERPRHRPHRPRATSSSERSSRGSAPTCSGATRSHVPLADAVPHAPGSVTDAAQADAGDGDGLGGQSGSPPVSLTAWRS